MADFKGSTTFRSVDGTELSLTTGRIMGLLMDRSPRVVFFHLRDTLGSIFGSHRREWLKRNELTFRKKRTANKLFFYRMQPRDKEKMPPPGVPVSLDRIKGEAYTRSKMALAHELGGTIVPTSGRMLAVPLAGTMTAGGNLRKGMRDPAEFRATFPDRDLVALSSGGGRVVLYEAKKGAAAARREGAVSRVSDGGKKARDREVLVPMFALVKSVRLRARLKFMSTWDELQADRHRRFGLMMTNIVRDISDGKPA